MKPATELVRHRRLPGEPYGAVSTPLYQTATFVQPGACEAGPYDYSRSGNPTRAALEEQLARLEGATRALAYGSGLAALAAVVRLAAPDGEVLAGDDLYGGTDRLLSRVLPELGLSTRYVNATRPQAVRDTIGPRTRLLLIETPTNPLLRVVDLAALAEICHERNVLLAVDGSLMTPWLQRPLALGADVVVHSATKGLGGHSDLTAGVVAVHGSEVAERLAFRQNAEGTALAPFDAWLLLRGLKTLGVRVERQEATARRIAAFLVAHPAVTRLHYPGLADHPGRALQLRQAGGFGPVMSFETGSVARSAALVDALELFPVAVSFGGVGSTASLPCRMSHAAIPAEVRRERRLPEDLVRLSIGLEDPDDLIEDLDRALRAVGGPISAAVGVGG
ncbi:MAG: trans-sulfuration enzyme family protein [Thermoanaerobaculia bacterium]